VQFGQLVVLTVDKDRLNEDTSRPSPSALVRRAYEVRDWPAEALIRCVAGETDKPKDYEPLIGYRFSCTPAPLFVVLSENAVFHVRGTAAAQADWHRDATAQAPTKAAAYGRRAYGRCALVRKGARWVWEH
jgi:hypothetical protein